MAKRTPIKAIRAKRLDCCCGQVQEVRLCIDDDCPLWEYRMGHRPKDDKKYRRQHETRKILSLVPCFYAGGAHMEILRILYELWCDQHGVILEDITEVTE